MTPNFGLDDAKIPGMQSNLGAKELSKLAQPRYWHYVEDKRRELIWIVLEFKENANLTFEVTNNLDSWWNIAFNEKLSILDNSAWIWIIRRTDSATVLLVNKTFDHIVQEVFKNQLIVKSDKSACSPRCSLPTIPLAHHHRLHVAWRLRFKGGEEKRGARYGRLPISCSWCRHSTQHLQEVRDLILGLS